MVQDVQVKKEKEVTKRKTSTLASLGRYRKFQSGSSALCSRSKVLHLPASLQLFASSMIAAWTRLRLVAVFRKIRAFRSFQMFHQVRWTREVQAFRFARGRARRVSSSQSCSCNVLVLGAKLAGRLAEFSMRLQSLIETVHVASRCIVDSG
jgi:hypothetical protein